MAPSRAYLDGLALLARRELSEAQVRERLARKGHTSADIDAVVAQLREERALDDARVAGSIARTQISVKRRSRVRARLEIERAGIAADVAAVEEAFSGVDDAVLLDDAIRRRLGGRETVADDREMQRLHRYLVGQGFAPEQVLAALRSRSKRHEGD